jgi:hypothetical protein
MFKFITSKLILITYRIPRFLIVGDCFPIDVVKSIDQRKSLKEFRTWILVKERWNVLMGIRGWELGVVLIQEPIQCIPWNFFVYESMLNF